jgi:hypothetical protein
MTGSTINQYTCAVVEVCGAERRPEVHVEDEVVVQDRDVALREQMLDRRLLELVREEQMALQACARARRSEKKGKYAEGGRRTSSRSSSGSNRSARSDTRPSSCSLTHTESLVNTPTSCAMREGPSSARTSAKSPTWNVVPCTATPTTPPARCTTRPCASISSSSRRAQTAQLYGGSVGGGVGNGSANDTSVLSYTRRKKYPSWSSGTDARAEKSAW